mmetsp:Transcript_25349/g.65883  ORF Transcript_25349/g.65883 Transcript_25349/m.65883 type:complete len:272 (-) Transcript_25349:2262-3077(-)
MAPVPTRPDAFTLMRGISPLGSRNVMSVDDAPPTRNTRSTDTSIPRLFSVSLTSCSVLFAKIVAQPEPPKATLILPSRGLEVPSRRVATDTVGDVPVSEEVVVSVATLPGKLTKVTDQTLSDASSFTFTLPSEGSLPIATSRSAGEASCGIASVAVLSCTNRKVPPVAPLTEITWTSWTAPCSTVVMTAEATPKVGVGAAKISPVFPSVLLNESQRTPGARSSTIMFRPRSWCSTLDNTNGEVSESRGRVVRPFNVSVKLPVPLKSSCCTS